jgi:hypothetical protein
MFMLPPSEREKRIGRLRQTRRQELKLVKQHHKNVKAMVRCLKALSSHTDDILGSAYEADDTSDDESSDVSADESEEEEQKQHTDNENTRANIDKINADNSKYSKLAREVRETVVCQKHSMRQHTHESSHDALQWMAVCVNRAVLADALCRLETANNQCPRRPRSTGTKGRMPDSSTSPPAPPERDTSPHTSTPAPPESDTSPHTSTPAVGQESSIGETTEQARTGPGEAWIALHELREVSHALKSFEAIAKRCIATDDAFSQGIEQMTGVRVLTPDATARRDQVFEHITLLLQQIPSTEQSQIDTQADNGQKETEFETLMESLSPVSTAASRVRNTLCLRYPVFKQVTLSVLMNPAKNELFVAFQRLVSLDWNMSRRLSGQKVTYSSDYNRMTNQYRVTMFAFKHASIGGDTVKFIKP